MASRDVSCWWFAAGGTDLDNSVAFDHSGDDERFFGDSEVFQLAYPRPRLRWTPDLHEQFVRAVDQLGGAAKATPKTIASIMRVEGVSLYHLKSHLQKYRLGKTSKKLSKKEFIPANYRRRNYQNPSPMLLEGQGSSSMSNEFNANGDMNTFGGVTSENYHYLVEPQTGLKISDMADNTSSAMVISQQEFAASEPITGVKMEEPSLLPFFSPIPAPGSYFPEWSELLAVDDKKPVVANPNDNPSMDDYLNSLGYYSSDQLACHGSMMFRSFFDEVERFPKVEHDHDVLMLDDNVAAMDVSAQFPNNVYYP